MTKFACLIAALAAVSACKKKTNEKPAEPTQGSAEAPAPADAVAPADATMAWDGKSPLSITEGFSTPESVLYDADADVYLVSNINGEPSGTDDNGYITKVSPDGKITEPKWIDGANGNVKLDAPKGMAIVDGVLYVADITAVRRFDAKTGEPKGDIEIKGSTFLNDIAPAPDGGIYVTDSGLDAKFAPTGTDAIYHLAKDGKLKTVIKDKSLGNPNGISAGADNSVWVVTFGSGEIYQVNAKGKKVSPQKLPKGQLDGIVELDGGDVLVSSWEGQAVYRGKPGGEWKPAVENVKSPADIGWDSKRKRLLIPIFQGNTVILHPLE
ncbi:MAG TPA: SMP-30/gluconolactonase/LRE family protein [Kofleriaceae bacterium]|nr:SMP-30/gluconolactonase/LRE family protein [Kofleriaceae bacterium]